MVVFNNANIAFCFMFNMAFLYVFPGIGTEIFGFFLRIFRSFYVSALKVLIKFIN